MDNLIQLVIEAHQQNTDVVIYKNHFFKFYIAGNNKTGFFGICRMYTKSKLKAVIKTKKVKFEKHITFKNIETIKQIKNKLL